MGTTAKDIIVAARGKLAATPTSRDAAANFKEHKTNQAFKKSPMSGADGFEVTGKETTLTNAFGVFSEKETQLKMLVTLGHAPYGTDEERENFRQRDIARVSDLLEAFAFPAGTSVVLFETESCDKNNDNWWVSELVFKVVFTGAIEVA